MTVRPFAGFSPTSAQIPNAKKSEWLVLRETVLVDVVIVIIVIAIVVDVVAVVIVVV